MKLDYNAPLILTFSLICVALFVADEFITHGKLRDVFCIHGNMRWNTWLSYPGLLFHPFVHADGSHLFYNLMMVLLLGPVVEEKYKPLKLAGLMTITALVTGVFHTVVFNTNALGASGLVFMLIILISFVNVKKGTIPFTFLLIFFIFIGQEVLGFFLIDNISQTAHIIGGICGAIFGFFVRK